VQLDSAEHNPAAAFADYKSYITYRDSIINEANTRKMVSEQMTYEFDKQQAIQKKEQEKKDAILIGIFVLAFLCAGIFFFQRRRMAKELARAKVYLSDYVKNMEEKNKLLEEFRTDIDKLKIITDDRRVAQLEHLNTVSILTDGDWTQFRLLFEQVYPNFFTHLKNKLPDLTQGEIRLICLTKLNIGTKQMAGILGVSDDTIRKTRYRLRKKLGLEGEDGIDDIVNSI
jgi:DNA-binding CsgD family transcriptional regulator